MYSHQVRIVLAEKGVNYEVLDVDPENKPEDLADLNPYNSVPTLVDRDLVLYEAQIIMEYLDERFPHPPLMPVYPVSRARSRLMIHRIEKDWYSLLKLIRSPKAGDARKEKAKRELRDALITLAPVFSDTDYFLSEEFTLVDCCLAPLLWRLELLGVELTGKGAKPVLDYMQRLFERESFKASLTTLEYEMRETEY
ncbi:MAG: glutathione S-transferase N-terminal domain-containing protein [Gammaproteobacteria bacterium]|nr:glutathione S-transferase N-terminal domain-containing protein [Gammaproteobacteria bacterium]